jgi:hypothetical protein
MALCSGLSGVVWVTVPAGPTRVTWVIRPSCRFDVSPSLAAAAFGDSGQQKGQPADQDVGADAMFEAVETGRSSRWVFRSRKPRSASSKFL